MYRGWISEELVRLGVRLGPLDEKSKTFDGCELTDGVLDRLGLLWGKYIWGLERVT